MSEEKEVYEKTFSCVNCGNFQHCEIPKGMTIGKFLTTNKCKNCGVLLSGKSNDVVISNKDL